MRFTVAAAFLATAGGAAAVAFRVGPGASSPQAAASHRPPGDDGSPSPSPSSSPAATPSPEPTATPTAQPTAEPSPTPPPAATPAPPPPTPAPAGGRCGEAAYAEVDRAADGSVDVLATLEGLCPVRTITTAVTVLTDAGTQVAATGNPASTTSVCATTCLPVGPGQGYGAVHTGIQPFVWSNWCGTPGLFHVAVRITADGVPSSTTVLVAAPPACVSAGQPSRLAAPRS